MKILITGASGYLGSKLTNSLINSGNDVALLLRLGSTSPISFQTTPRLEFGRYSSDLDIFEFIKHSQPNLIIHTAGCYGRSNETHNDIVNANIGLGVSILNSLVHLKKPVSFINIGTSLPSSISFYALTKNEFINFGRWFSGNSEGKLQFVNLEVEHFYGPGESGSKFIPYLLDKCLTNSVTIDLTSGVQERDLLYIDDLVNACNLIIEKLPNIDSFKSIPIGSGETMSIKNVALLIHRLTGSESILKFGALPLRMNEVMYSKPDLMDIEKLGWKPLVSIDSGIRRVVAHEILIRSNM